MRAMKKDPQKCLKKLKAIGQEAGLEGQRLARFVTGGMRALGYRQKGKRPAKRPMRPPMRPRMMGY